MPIALGEREVHGRVRVSLRRRCTPRRPGATVSDVTVPKGGGGSLRAGVSRVCYPCRSPVRIREDKLTQVHEASSVAGDEIMAKLVLLISLHGRHPMVLIYKYASIARLCSTIHTVMKRSTVPSYSTELL